MRHIRNIIGLSICALLSASQAQPAWAQAFMPTVNSQTAPPRQAFEPHQNYNYTYNTCHTSANCNVLNGATDGILRCTGNPLSMGGHTINYTVRPAAPGQIQVNFINNNGNSCLCHIPTGAINSQGKLDEAAVTSYGDCNICIEEFCSGQYQRPEEGQRPTITILPPGQLGHIPGDSTCVRQTLGIAGSVPYGVLDGRDPERDQVACLSCCDRSSNTILAWLEADKTLSETEKRDQNAERLSFLSNCRTMCRGTFALPELHPTPPAPLPVPPPIGPFPATPPVKDPAETPQGGLSPDDPRYGLNQAVRGGVTIFNNAINGTLPIRPPGQ